MRRNKLLPDICFCGCLLVWWSIAVASVNVQLRFFFRIPGQKNSLAVKLHEATPPFHICLHNQQWLHHHWSNTPAFHPGSELHVRSLHDDYISPLPFPHRLQLPPPEQRCPVLFTFTCKNQHSVQLCFQQVFLWASRSISPNPPSSQRLAIRCSLIALIYKQTTERCCGTSSRPGTSLWSSLDMFITMQWHEDSYQEHFRIPGDLSRSTEENSSVYCGSERVWAQRSVLLRRSVCTLRPISCRRHKDLKPSTLSCGEKLVV